MTVRATPTPIIDVHAHYVTATWPPPMPGSGTGELTGLRGEGSLAVAVGRSAAITLDHRFE